MHNRVDMWLSIFVVSVILLQFASSEDFYNGSLCNLCACKNQDPYQIVCTMRSLTNMLNDDQWPQHKSSGSILYEINFDDNGITEITPLPPVPVFALSFSSNKIKKIASKAFYNVSTELQSLDLSHNELTHDSFERDAFMGKYSDTAYEPLALKLLNLSGNQIKFVDKDLFVHLANLETLNMEGNPLTVLTHQTITAITSLRNLTELYLADTGLSEIPTGFFHALTKLQTLDLRNNQFVSVPGDLRYASTLHSLNIGGNPIVELDDFSFAGLDSLQHLFICNMAQLYRIGPLTFSNLKHLTKLDCSYNPRLTEISVSAFQGITNDTAEWPIKSVSFANNALITLDQNLVAWNRTIELDIQGNPWICDCRVEWIVKTLVPLIQNQDPQKGVLELTCDEPQTLHGKQMVSLSLDPTIFKDCNDGLSIFQFGISDNVTVDYILSSTGLALTLLFLLLLVLGTIGLAFVYLRRKNMRPFVGHSQIRYVRAKSNDMDSGYI